MSPVETAEAIVSRFGRQTRVGPRNPVLDGEEGPDLPTERDTYAGTRAGPL